MSVSVASGRTFRGIVDPRTDSQQLWIRCVYGQAVVLRPVSWERICLRPIEGTEPHGRGVPRIGGKLEDRHAAPAVAIRDVIVSSDRF